MMGFKMNLFLLMAINLCFLSSQVSGKVCHEVCEAEPNSTTTSDNTERLFQIVKSLDDKHETLLAPLVKLDESDMDEKINNTFLIYGGIVDNQRKKENMRYEVTMVPSFLQLGDYHMIDLADKTIFFHELQTTANTIFELRDLTTNFRDFYQSISLNLNNLKLVGIAEFVQKSGSPDYMHLHYEDTTANASIWIRKVEFEGTLYLRVAGNTFIVENVRSSLKHEKITLTYKFNGTDKAVPLEPGQGECITSALNDLIGRWLTEYMNTILDEHIDLPEIMGNQLEDLRKYFYERTQILNSFLDPAMANVEGVMKPFVLSTPYGVSVNFTKGTYHDISSLYRDKPTTAVFYPDSNKTEYNMAFLSGRFRFSRLKLYLTYVASIPQMSVPLQGVVVVVEDQAYMNMNVKVVADQLQWMFTNSYSADSFTLTVQGPLSRYYYTVKHIFTHQILTLAKLNMNDIFSGIAVKV